MVKVDQVRAGILAEYLGSLLPAASGDDPPEEHEDGQRVDGVDVDVLLHLELQELVSRNPELGAAPGGPTEPSGNGDVAERLKQLLAEREGHCPRMLWELFADGGDKHQPADDGTADRPRNRWRTAADSLLRITTDGWVRRQVAGVWMNVLVGTVLLVAWLVAWQSAPAALEPGPLALAVFVVWCLSFLPGWLYIRFLGQRAGALWDEYVLCLHRLAWDSPRYLPRPPVTSEYYTAWFNDGGALLAHRENIYRKKFDAYYGKSVSESVRQKKSAIRIETLFPVFLTTATLAVCWTVVLWDPSFIRDPNGVWDILKFGFLGAYLFIFQMLIRRFFQSDLRPSAYASALLRIITVLIVVTSLNQLMLINRPEAQAAAAFIIGFFPLVGIHALQRAAAAALRTAVPSLSPPYPLNQIDGLSVWYEARLLEEGIEDMESLATANFVDVILHTRVPVGRLVDWVDQAHLYLHMDRMERGWLDRTFHGTKDPHRVADTLSRGSVTNKSRAGTRTRTALRQLGIRKATDLLKAFPPDQMDPDVLPARNSPWEAHLQSLKKDGVDLCQLRTMVRVLSRDRSLAPVWNWQRRGVRVVPDAESAA
jgi:hypothetical protein